MEPLVFAHAGHWLLNLLYAVPVLLVVAIIVRDRWVNRHARADAPGRDAPDRRTGTPPA